MTPADLEYPHLREILAERDEALAALANQCGRGGPPSDGWAPVEDQPGWWTHRERAIHVRPTRGGCHAISSEYLGSIPAYVEHARAAMLEADLWWWREGHWKTERKREEIARKRGKG